MLGRKYGNSGCCLCAGNRHGLDEGTAQRVIAIYLLLAAQKAPAQLAHTDLGSVKVLVWCRSVVYPKVHNDKVCLLGQIHLKAWCNVRGCDTCMG